MHYRLRLYGQAKSFVNVCIFNPVIKAGDVFELNGKKWLILNRISVAQELDEKYQMPPNNGVLTPENYDELIIQEIPSI